MENSMKWRILLISSSFLYFFYTTFSCPSVSRKDYYFTFP